MNQLDTTWLDTALFQVKCSNALLSIDRNNFTCLIILAMAMERNTVKAETLMLFVLFRMFFAANSFDLYSVLKVLVSEGHVVSSS